MRTRDDGVEAERDPVASLHDTEAEAGEEAGLEDTLDVDEREAAELGVDLDATGATEPELD